MGKYQFTDLGRKERDLSQELSEAGIKPSAFERLAKSINRWRGEESYSQGDVNRVLESHNKVYSRRAIDPREEDKWERCFVEDANVYYLLRK